MEIISKPIKFDRWQVTKIIDNFGKEKIEIKYFSKNKTGGLNWNKYQVIYATIPSWKELKKKIKKK